MSQNPEVVPSIIVAAVSFIVIALVGLLPSTNLLRETSNPQSPYSFSKFQLWLWTLVICPLVSIHWGYANCYHAAKGANCVFDYINETSLVLLAISGGVTLTSTVIKQVQQASSLRPGYLAAHGLTTLKPGGTSNGFWADILSDDDGQFSIGRLQNFIFTLIFLVVYVVYFFQNGDDYVDFESKVYLLMGISSGTYLISRGLFK